MKKDRKHKILSNKKLCRVLFILIGVFFAIIGMVVIPILREVIADKVLSDINKKIYIAYTLESDGVIIPASVNYVTNNGKLFAFCHSLSSVIVAILFLIICKAIYIKEFKDAQIDLTKIIGIIEIVVLILGVFTFTSKISPNNNIDKYVIKSSGESYTEPTDFTSGNTSSIIGYVKKADLQQENGLIAVYKSPQLESAPTDSASKSDSIGMGLVRNIGEINIWAETLTIILGVYVFVLRDYQKNTQDIKTSK